MNSQQAARRRAPPIRQSGTGKQALNWADIWRPTRIDNTVGQIHMNTAGKAIITYPTGDYVYRALPFYITSDSEIVGDTTQIGGVHVINTDKVKNYIWQVRLMINGSPLHELTVEELQMRNGFHDIDFDIGQVGFQFPGDIYYQDKHRDAFSLGTANVNSLTMELAQTANFNAGTMQIHTSPWFVRDSKPIAFTHKTERVSHTFAAAGKHTFMDIPVADAIKDIWIKGAGITAIKLVVDGKTMFDCTRMEYRSMLIANGRLPNAVGDNWFIDFHHDGQPVSLAALDLPHEVRRGAKIKLDITTTSADTQVDFIITQSGYYADIR